MTPDGVGTVPRNDAIQIGLLDFGTVPPGGTADRTIVATFERAALAEQLGFSRYWLAEHHEMRVAWASANPLLGALAVTTKRIRVGSAGVLLSYYDPMAVANDFMLLSEIAPERIDLGISRGMSGHASRLSVAQASTSTAYEERVELLVHYLRRPAGPSAFTERALPYLRLDSHAPQVWILGSSQASAQLAGRLGANLGISAFHKGAAPVPNGARLRATGITAAGRPSFVIALAGICASTKSDAQALLREHTNEWILPNVVGTVEDCAQYVTRLRETTGACEFVFLDLALDPSARLASCHHLSELRALLSASP